MGNIRTDRVLTGTDKRDMTSEEEYTVLFAILRAGLWEKEAELSAFPPALTVKDWRRMLELARQQTVTGIIYRGLSHLPDQFFPAEEILLRLTAETYRIERINRCMNEAVRGLFSFFRESGLHPVLLKGQGVGIMYDHPMLRTAGDIDLCFTDRMERERARQLVCEAGLHPETMPDGSLVYQWHGIEVEHHPRLFDMSNPFLRKYREITECDKNYVRLTPDAADDMMVTVPAPTLNLLLLNTHILKHVMGKGIGLRQLCDMARACHILHDKVDGTEIRRIYRRCGILRWSRLLHSFLVNDLGMPAGDLPYEERLISADPLRKIILRGGNFGQYRYGCRRKIHTGWWRKWHTACAFLNNLHFSLRYAPGETFRTIATLTKGQFR